MRSTAASSATAAERRGSARAEAAEPCGLRRKLLSVLRPQESPAVLRADPRHRGYPRQREQHSQSKADKKGVHEYELWVAAVAHARTLARISGSPTTGGGRQRRALVSHPPQRTVGMPKVGAARGERHARGPLPERHKRHVERGTRSSQRAPHGRPSNFSDCPAGYRGFDRPGFTSRKLSGRLRSTLAHGQEPLASGRQRRGRGDCSRPFAFSRAQGSIGVAQVQTTSGRELGCRHARWRS